MVKLISKFRFLFLFILLLVFVLVKAINKQYDLLDFADTFILFLMLFSLLIIGNKRKGMAYWLLLPIFAELSLYLLGHFCSQPVIHVTKFFMAALFMIIMTVICLIFTFSDKRINITTLFGSLCAYLFLGLAFAYIYLIMSEFFTNSFIGFSAAQENHAIYYSFVTLTTLGFGDVLPLVPIAKTVSWIEAFFGQAYLAVIMAQLVGRYVASQGSEK